MDDLVSSEWLAAALDAGDLRVLDASLFLPDHKRDARADYVAAHVPGARFLDLAGLRDTSDPLPNMVPTAAQFAAHLGALGVSETDRIVVYDDSPLHSATRAWWLLRHFGARQVAVLDGGLAGWIAAGHATESGLSAIAPAVFHAGAGALPMRDKAAMLANVDNRTEQVADARGPARFSGVEAEPRADMASGHIPGARNLPYARLIGPDGAWLQGDALRAAFADAGIDLNQPIAATCGSGITATALIFGAHLLGKSDVALYDGSWSDWGSDPDIPKETGTA